MSISPWTDLLSGDLAYFRPPRALSAFWDSWISVVKQNVSLQPGTLFSFFTRIMYLCTLLYHPITNIRYSLVDCIWCPRAKAIYLWLYVYILTGCMPPVTPHFCLPLKQCNSAYPSEQLCIRQLASLLGSIIWCTSHLLQPYLLNWHLNVTLPDKVPIRWHHRCTWCLKR